MSEHDPQDGSPHGKIAEVWFSPGRECRRRITMALDRAQHSIDICVFTITDNELARAIIAAHQRGRHVRVLSDNDKARDRGSDIDEFIEAGLHVAVDQSRHHMHHKSAVIDQSLLLTGSYNWTRSAAQHNEENLLVTDDPRLVKPYVERFDLLWKTYTKDRRRS